MRFFYKKPAPLSRIMRIEKTNRIRMIIFCDVKLHIKRKGHRYPNFKKQRSNARAHKEILLTAPSNTNPEPSLLSLPAQGTTTSHLPSAIACSLISHLYRWPLSTQHPDILCLSNVLLTYSADFFCHCSLLWSLPSGYTCMLPLQILTHSRSAPTEPCAGFLSALPQAVHSSLLLNLPMMLPTLSTTLTCSLFFQST